MIISRKRFEEECQKREAEAVRQVEESHWRRESEQAQGRFIEKLEERLIAVEKACSIDHPSHHRGDNVRSIW